MTALVLAGLSARLMAEAAVRNGYTALALDVFGDIDTRRVAAHWSGIGVPGALRIDADRLLAALEDLAAREEVLGWVAGSGFEDQPELLEAGAKILPLIGTPPSAVRRVRDPRVFFDFLAARGIAHPEVRFHPPAIAAGWLSKHADGTGGWHIRAADANEALWGEACGRYYQRRAAGTPMSALFVADGHRASVLGFNELIVRSLGGHPFVYCGAIGPIALAPGLAAGLDELVQTLSREFRLEGLCSLDFLLDGSNVVVLEINPRPSASMALYLGVSGTALMHSHVLACLHGRLSRAPQQAGVRGTEIVFARGALQLSATQADRLAAQADTHDLPSAGAAFSEGDPVCSVSAAGSNTVEVRARLTRRREAILNLLEPSDERSPADHLLCAV